MAAPKRWQIFHGKMDKGYEKERFESLSIKSSIAKKFRRFSRSIGQSQSMALLLMLEFFEMNQLSPKERMGPHMQTLATLIKKRNNAIIAIMKDIEKNQTRPTVAMLQSLFEGMEPNPNSQEQPLMLEKKQFEKDKKHYEWELPQFVEKKKND